VILDKQLQYGKHLILRLLSELYVTVIVVIFVDVFVWLLYNFGKPTQVFMSLSSFENIELPLLRKEKSHSRMTHRFQ